MMKLAAGKVRLSLPKSDYSRPCVEAAALALGRRAAAYLEESAKSFEVTLRAEGSRELLRTLAGEFLNEALNYEYRQRVVGFHADLTSAVLSPLFSKGFPAMPADPLEELEPQVRLDRQRDTEELLKAAERLEEDA